MDINDLNVNDLRVAVTLLSFGVFAGIVRWALLRRNRTSFDEAAQLPFVNDSADGVISPPSSLRSLPPEGAPCAVRAAGRAKP